MSRRGGDVDDSEAGFPHRFVSKVRTEARAAGKALIAEGQAAGPKRKTFIFVNNRLEGNALGTIAAMAGLPD